MLTSQFPRGAGVAFTCVGTTWAGLDLLGGMTTSAVSQPIRTTGSSVG